MQIYDMLSIVKASEKRTKYLREEYKYKNFDEMHALDIVLTSDTVKDVPPRLLQSFWWKQDPLGQLSIAEMRMIRGPFSRTVMSA